MISSSFYSAPLAFFLQLSGHTKVEYKIIKNEFEL